MVASSPASILPMTTSASVNEVINSSVSVCLSFSWLTAEDPASAAMNSSTTIWNGANS